MVSKRRGEDADVWVERRREAGQGDRCGLNTPPGCEEVMASPASLTFHR